MELDRDRIVKDIYYDVDQVKKHLNILCIALWVFGGWCSYFAESSSSNFKFYIWSIIGIIMLVTMGFTAARYGDCDNITKKVSELKKDYEQRINRIEEENAILKKRLEQMRKEERIAKQNEELYNKGLLL